MTVDAPPKFELMYTGRAQFREEGKPDIPGFEPVVGTYEEVSKKAVSLNPPLHKKGQITRLFFPEMVKEPDADAA